LSSTGLPLVVARAWGWRTQAGDRDCSGDQDRCPVIHNPQDLLPLL